MPTSFMATPLPRIAVLIPSYKAELRIGKALGSLKANMEPHDVVIVDDGSPTPLQDVLEPQDNLTILRLEANRGIVGALNHGLQHIAQRGYEFVARMDDDDMAAPNRLAMQRAFMDEHASVALLGTWGQVMSEQGETLFHLNHPTDHASIVRGLYDNSRFLHPSMLIRMAALREVGFYSDDYPSAEDYELARRVSRRYDVANLPHYLIAYTWSSGGISASKRRQQLGSRLKVQWRYRSWASPFFYTGVLKTCVLWFIPARLLLAIKQRLPVYQRH